MKNRKFLIALFLLVLTGNATTLVYAADNIFFTAESAIPEYFPVGMKWVNYSQWWDTPPFTYQEKFQVTGMIAFRGEDYARDAKIVESPRIDIEEYGIHQYVENSWWWQQGKKIYGMPADGEAEDALLMYDFSLEAGDVIDSYMYSPSTVTATDSVTLLDGRRAKRIFYDNRSPDIEYIGSTDGFIFPRKHTYEEENNPTWPFDWLGRWFCYCAQGENVIYSTGEAVCSEEAWSAIRDIPADELLAVSDGVLMLKGVEKSTATAVFTPDGQRVMTFTGDKTDISSLPSGLYILRTGTLTAKFVK